MTDSISARAMTPYAVGDRIKMKKPHPCGGYDWEVYRVGADIGLQCQRCQRRVMLTRREIARRISSHIRAAG